MRARESVLLCAVCAGSVIASGAVQAQSPSGTAVAVVQATSIAGAAGSRVLRINAPVYTGDRVNTDTIGEAQIVFRDDTRLVVGPNSSLVIDRFVFNPDSTPSDVAIRFSKGTLRFISGRGDDRAYSIITPTATIGIRGTGFDCATNAALGTACAIAKGAIDVCNRSGQCVSIEGGSCEVAVVPPGGSAQEATGEDEKAALLQASFPYVVSQASLRQDFQLDMSACGLQGPDSQTQHAQAGQNIAPIVGIAATMSAIVIVPLAVSDDGSSPVSP